MTAARHVADLGVRRGLAQYVQVLRSRDGFFNTVFFNGIPVAAFLLLRDSRIEGTDVPVALFAMPGTLASMIVFGAVLNAAYNLSFDREDGTLLRMMALPRGISAYVTGRVVQDSVDTLVGFTIVLVGGLLVVPALAIGGPGNLLLLAVLVILGLLATIPVGLIVGSVLRNPRLIFSVGVLGLATLTVVSGIWFPIQAMPDWLGAIAQVFPMYWLGLGMRAVFLPEAAVALEVGGSWRLGEAFLVVGAWAAGGLLLAPRMLRRMAARESGATVAGARDRALQRA